MNSRSNIICSLLTVVSFMALVMSMTGMVRAQSSLKVTGKATGKATGEIASASQTTINGYSAISGMTVFSNNRIRTAGHGAAIINLGRIGRIELGRETDMTLSFSRAGIGGELHSNNVVVSAPAGVAISIKTAKGMVTTDGKKPAVLTIYADSKRARVMAHIGEAIVTSSSNEGRIKTDRVAEGEELSQSSAIAVARAARMADQTASSVVATAPPDGSGIAGLFNAGIGYSIAPESDIGSSYYGVQFETSVTCRNNDKKPCRKKSEFKP
jgi:hypothetical protein